MLWACLSPGAGPGCGAPSGTLDQTPTYQEMYRPQLHFTPPRNWMNDPNGLVFYDGEYHLFYQYNPFGTRWGHMSWGHAISLDLVHWEHYPVAIPEADGVMAFSGSAVVDWNNSSGFGNGERPPLVAIYTGYREAEKIQAQYLAYSNDRGRSWMTYSGNPVLDRGLADFRDPKVFWHEPTQRWIMVVALSADHKVQFYESTDLKSWTLMSEFGPAGSDQGLWECPDLFPLTVEDGSQQDRWVLQVDLGDGAVAGGSGGQYFLGYFDGRQFEAQPLGASAWAGPGLAQWVDYGQDFYAAVSWSDVPVQDGRRLWIGWMNNWQYAQEIPTDPWRSAQSLPRSLHLRNVGDGLRLAQQPVRELQSLRERFMQIEARQLSDETFTLSETGFWGRRLEILAEFEPETAREFGLRVRVGQQEGTVIGYDVTRSELFVDRTRSGRSDFHPLFARRHAGPLPLRDGRLRLQIFVDRSSVEVFGNDGLTVLTDQIFPSLGSEGLEVYAVGGSVKLHSFTAWQLRSIWR